MNPDVAILLGALLPGGPLTIGIAIGFLLVTMLPVITGSVLTTRRITPAADTP